jgi:hypothetical protein
MAFFCTFRAVHRDLHSAFLPIRCLSPTQGLLCTKIAVQATDSPTAIAEAWLCFLLVES